MVRSATGPRPLVAAIAGGLIGVLAAVGLAMAGWPDHEASDPGGAAGATPAAARRFVVEWRRSRLGTWVVEARFERVTAAGRRIEAAVHMAQRPPDRLVTGLGTIDARRGGERLACSSDEAGQLVCRDGGPARPYEAEVEDDIDVLREYVLGPSSFYAVRQHGDCFTLRLRRPVLSPPYGRRARFCFDPATGAPVRADVERREAVDHTVAVEVRSDPTDADLDPERWGGGGRG